MANEIHNTLKNNQQPMKLARDRVESTSQQLPEASQQVSSDRSGQSDRVTLTDAAAKLHDLSRQLADEPFVDTQRVDRIKQQLADGSYKIDAAQIADKLLEQEQSLRGA
jgi:negative regulator of flagellin synthesis FlgM